MPITTTPTISAASHRSSPRAMRAPTAAARTTRNPPYATAPPTPMRLAFFPVRTAFAVISVRASSTSLWMSWPSWDVSDPNRSPSDRSLLDSAMLHSLVAGGARAGFGVRGAPGRPHRARARGPVVLLLAAVRAVAAAGVARAGAVRRGVAAGVRRAAVARAAVARAAVAGAVAPGPPGPGPAVAGAVARAAVPGAEAPAELAALHRAATLRRRLEEPRRDEPERERATEEHGGLAPREVLGLANEPLEVGLAEELARLVDLLGGRVSERRDLRLLVAHLVAALADRLRDLVQHVRAAAQLAVHLRPDLLLGRLRDSVDDAAGRFLQPVTGSRAAGPEGSRARGPGAAVCRRGAGAAGIRRVREARGRHLVLTGADERVDVAERIVAHGGRIRSRILGASLRRHASYRPFVRHASMARRWTVSVGRAPCRSAVSSAIAASQHGCTVARARAARRPATNRGAGSRSSWSRCTGRGRGRSCRGRRSPTACSRRRASSCRPPRTRSPPRRRPGSRAPRGGRR